MPADRDKPILKLDPPSDGKRTPGPRNKIPPPPPYLTTRQTGRFGPAFQRLAEVVQREGNAMSLRSEPDAIAPETLLVFETKGPLISFAKACEEIGLRIIADDALDITDENGPEQGHYYLTMPDQSAIEQLLRLWDLWSSQRPLGDHEKWAMVFSRLHDLRRWGPNDRVTDDDAAAISEDLRHAPDSIVRVELELAFHPGKQEADDLRTAVEQAIKGSGGTVVKSARFPEIAYDAMLVDLTASEAARIISRDNSSIAGRAELFSIRPQSALNVTANFESAVGAQVEAPNALGEPIVAILDAFPQQNHDFLGSRIEIHDHFSLEARTVGPRVHGTAMASLVIRGDLAKNDPALPRRVAFLPIMYSAVDDPQFVDEAPPSEELIVDLLVRAVRRLKVGDATGPALAPGVVIINLSLGDKKRPFVNRVSALARVVDWLSSQHGILINVSAGNVDRLVIPNTTAAQFRATVGDLRGRTTLKGISADLRNRRLLPPAEAMNCLTIGALHDDEIASPPDLGESRDPMPVGILAAPTSRVGLGYRNAVKPDLLFPGGRLRALLSRQDETVAELIFNGGNQYGGVRAAGPGNATGGQAPVQFSGSTSAATALATRAGHQIYDALEEAYGTSFSGLSSSSRALIVKALMVHRTTIPDESRELIVDVFGPLGKSQGGKRKANVQRVFGYGIPDIDEAIACVESRATLWGEGKVGENDAKIFAIPLPKSLSGQRGLRKLTVTLAWFTPVQAGRRAYRGVRLLVEEPDFRTICSNPVGGQPDKTPRGTVFQRTWEGKMARNFADGDTLKLRVARSPDQGDDTPDEISFGLAVTVETSITGLPIYAEVRAPLAIKPRVPVPIAAAR